MTAVTAVAASGSVNAGGMGAEADDESDGTPDITVP
jgi:hypothetical protein